MNAVASGSPLSRRFTGNRRIRTNAQSGDSHMTFNRSRTTLAVLAAGAASLMMADRALGDHRNPTVITHRHTFGARSHRPAPLPVARPCLSPAEIDYQRGFDSGREKGFHAGYSDGVRNGRYDNCVTASFCNLSRHFERGYRAAFSSAYQAGYQQGQRDRCHTHVRHRHRW